MRGYRTLLALGVSGLWSLPLAAQTATPGVAPAVDPSMQPAPATDATEEIVGDIVVTARRRAESAQNVPSTLNVLTSETLEQSGISNSFDLTTRVPALAIAPSDREVNVAIRGIANNVRSIGADPSNAASLNGVYLPRANMVLTELYDVQRVEVLKGPQGTLYGRNSTGGAINIISADPTDELKFNGFVGGGSNDLFRAQGAVSGGNDLVQVRIAGNYAKDHGYTRNLAADYRLDQIDYQGIRGTVRLTPGDQFKATLFWQHSRDDSGLGYGGSTDPGRGGPDSFAAFPADQQRVGPRDIRLNSPVYARRSGDIGGLTLDWDLGAVAVRSISGYTYYRERDAQDGDGTAADFLIQTTGQNYRSYSQEFQAFSNGKGRFDWIVGGFLYRDRGSETIDLSANFGEGYEQLALLLTKVRSNSQAIYGQATYNVTDQLAAIVGGRYTHDEKSGRRQLTSTFPGLQGKTSSSKFTPSFQLQYKPNSDVMIYGNVTEGYKSGGINGQDTTGNPTFGPEQVWSYEGGIKTQLFDRRVTFNVAAFHMDYSDIQFRTAIVTPTRVIVAITNGSSANISGAELDLSARLGGGFSVDLNGSYLDTAVKNYVSVVTGAVINGRPLPLAPKWSGSAGLLYDQEIAALGQVTARLEYSYRSRVIFPITYDAVFNSDNKVGLVNATLRWTEPKRRFYVEGIVRNVTKELYRINRQDNLPDGLIDVYGAPRLFEVRAGFNF